MPDANSAQKRISIAQGNALTVQELKNFLEGLDPSLEVGVLKPRAGLKQEIYPPELFKISRMDVNEDWGMLDLRIEKVLDDGE